MYNFDLPKALIAREPASPRDHARLLVYSLSDGSITNDIFRNIGKYLKPTTTLTLNNSKVEHCRWLFDGGIEIFVLQKLDTHTIVAMVRKGKKFRAGMKMRLTDWLEVETLAIDDDGLRTLRLNIPHDDRRLLPYEHVPMPPYIPQNDALSEEYQTVYAKPLGSKAAPTAGLHFTPELLKQLAKLHDIAEITLHVGLGTFAPLTDQQLKSGHLHAEQYELSDEATIKITNAKHITAVGTTTVRTLETVFGLQKFESTKIGQSPDFNKIINFGSTDILIRPGYKFNRVDSMITNFHLPSTSLLLLVAAFIADKKGLSEVQAAQELMRIYNHAITQKYRFYSFGDAMLIV